MLISTSYVQTLAPATNLVLDVFQPSNLNLLFRGSGEAIPLEYNLVGLKAINFDKGCYVGQEFIARTHHRGTIRKRLLPLKFLTDGGKELEQKLAPGSEVIDAASGKKAGTVTTALGCRGLGLLQLDEAFKGSGTLPIREQQEAIRPKWWPSEWLQEHQERSAVA